MFFSHKKEWKKAISYDVDKHWVCCKECSKSEREKQILCTDEDIQNLEKWYCWIFAGHIDQDIEDGLPGTEGEGEGEMNWESSTELYTLWCLK